jgi:hypothetical protein
MFIRDGFVGCYHPASRHKRTETDRIRVFPYDESVSRDNSSPATKGISGHLLTPR